MSFIVKCNNCSYWLNSVSTPFLCRFVIRKAMKCGAIFWCFCLVCLLLCCHGRYYLLSCLALSAPACCITVCSLLKQKAGHFESYRPSLSTAEGSGKAICILTRVTVRVECRRCSLKHSPPFIFDTSLIERHGHAASCQEIYNPAHIHAFDWLHFMVYSSVYLADHGSIHSRQWIHFLLIFVYLRDIFFHFDLYHTHQRKLISCCI